MPHARPLPCSPLELALFLTGGINSIFLISRGNITFQNVQAGRNGGCIYLHKYKAGFGVKKGNYKMTMARLAKDVTNFTLARTRTQYTLYSSNYIALETASHAFRGCKSAVGGGIFIEGQLLVRGHVEFLNVIATSVRGGAAVNARRVDFESPVAIANASVPDGGVIVTSNAMNAQQLAFINSPAPQIQSATRIQINGSIVVKGTPASMLAPTRTITMLSCDNGLEGYVDAIETGCHSCRPGFFQLQGGPSIQNTSEILGHSCIQAPEGTEQEDQIIRIRPGFMILPETLSRSFRCPNLMACPGGHIMATEHWKDLCETGYEGPGCVNCHKGTHGRVSNNPFACASCARGPVRKVLEWSWFVLQNSVIFAVSASGVLMVGEESYKSTILTNQLMSYVTVSLPVLTAVSYSRTFENSAALIQDILETLQIPVAIADSGGGEGLSVQCLLGYVGLRKTLYGTDFVFCTMALLLMAALGLLVDFWSAVVVGFNCFLPRICFCLGRHLVCYRMLPQAQGGDLVCGFDEDATIPKPMTYVLIAVCFVVGSGMWAVLIRYRRESSSPGVKYLTNAYTEECRMWEITVLLRKMTLMVVNAILPVSLHAALQMECITVILLISLVMNHKYSPYVLKAWNNSESVLLILALATVTLTSCYKANELDWAQSATAQQSLMVMIILLATGPAVFMGIRITIALYREIMEDPVLAAPKELKGDG
ncbi:GIP [Symbiodinium pilosum]|uniref:GIP protein n=1 Tax=Symbiodinium pilosum TaxID=2952 RepID=A0A812YAU1_SYMPI|nr:GIP [Symbiodinium pilosum]